MDSMRPIVTGVVPKRVTPPGMKPMASLAETRLRAITTPLAGHSLDLAKNLLLFYTNFKRDASSVLREQIQETPNKIDTLKKNERLNCTFA